MPARFTALDAPRVSVVGNLKFDVPPPPADRSLLASLRGRDARAGRSGLQPAPIPARRRSSPTAHRAAQVRDFPDLLTIIAPRHPGAGRAIAEALGRAGLNVVQRSRGFLPDSGTDLYVADTVGELGLLYRLASIVFVGGTLVRKGGQNPIEPAKLDCAILHGPHVDNFIEAFAALDRSGGRQAASRMRPSLADEVGRPDRATAPTLRAWRERGPRAWPRFPARSSEPWRRSTPI